MPGPPSSGVQNANGPGVRVAELVAALSYAADLGLGQPLAHCMRQTVIAFRLADLVGATQDEREATYYLGLMVSTYCHADAAEQARWFGDDIAFKADAFDMLGKNTAQIVAFAVCAAPARTAPVWIEPGGSSGCPDPGCGRSWTSWPPTPG